jgi:putative hydrolase of the HAD superfamily
MPIKAVLFDMFDTLILIDSNYEFYNQAVVNMHQYVTNHGVNVTYEQFYDAYVQARDDLYAKADESLEEPHFNVRIQNALQLLGYNYNISNPIVTGATGEFAQKFVSHVQIDEYTKPVLQNLQSNYQLGLVSNFAIPETIYSLLKTNDLTSLLDPIVISGEVNKRKPSPEIFQIALKKLDISPENAVFVGDTADADVAGAHAVGMKAVYIKRRVEQTLEMFSPDVIIESLADLPSVLKTF